MSVSELTNKVFERDGWKCRHCRSRNGLHAHHLIYRSHGGPDELLNLLTLCAQCHRAHHDGNLVIAIAWGCPIDENNPNVLFTRMNDWKPV